jgi:hypothetical protein
VSCACEFILLSSAVSYLFREPCASLTLGSWRKEQQTNGNQRKVTETYAVLQGTGSTLSPQRRPGDKKPYPHCEDYSRRHQPQMGVCRLTYTLIRLRSAAKPNCKRSRQFSCSTLAIEIRYTGCSCHWPYDRCPVPNRCRPTPVIYLRCALLREAVGWGTALQDGRSGVPFPKESFEFFIDIPSGRTVALGSTQKWVSAIIPGVKATGA